MPQFNSREEYEQWKAEHSEAAAQREVESQATPRIGEPTRPRC